MTRRGYVAGALVALVLLVVPLGLVPYVLGPVSGGDRPSASPVEQRVAGDPGVAASLSCDDSATPAPSAPTGVVAARLCAIDNRNTSWFGPQDGLHSGLAPLVDLLASLEPLPESTDESSVICTNDGGNAFDLRLALASGEVVSVPGDTGGCSTVTIGGEEVGGSDEVVATFMDALAAQRIAEDPPADLVALPLGCGQTRPDRDHRLSVIGDPTELVRAVTCWRPNAPEVGPWRDQRRVPPRLLARLVDDLSSRSVVQDGFGEPDCTGGDAGYYWQDLVGQTRWGDVVAVRGVCRELLASPLRSWEHSDGRDGRFWHPSPSAQRILDQLRR